MRLQQLYAALNKGRVDVVLCSRVGLLELLLGGKTRRSEGRVHQHYVEPSAEQINQRDALRSVTGKQPPARAGTIESSLSKAPQSLNDLRVGDLEEAIVIDTREVKLTLPLRGLEAGEIPLLQLFLSSHEELTSLVDLRGYALFNTNE